MSSASVVSRPPTACSVLRAQLPGADSIYLRLSQLLERQRQELGRFRAGLDGSVAQGGMSLQEQDAGRLKNDDLTLVFYET